MHSSPNTTSTARAGISNLPVEILAAILSLVSLHCNTIKPLPWLPGTSKFALENEPSLRRDRPQLRNAVPTALNAFSLALVCKDFHAIMNGDNLFYKVNTFEFSTYEVMLDYLKALPSSRRNAIRNIKLLCNPWQQFNGSFIVLSSLKNLTHLTLDVSLMAEVLFGPGAPDQSQDFMRLTTLRGLKSLKFTYERDTEAGILASILEVRQEFPTRENVHLLLEEVAHMQLVFDDAVQKPRLQEEKVNTLAMREALGESMVVEGGTTHLPTILSTITALEAFNQFFPYNGNHNSWEVKNDDSNDWPRSSSNTPWDAGGEWSNDSTPRDWLPAKSLSRRNSM